MLIRATDPARSPCCLAAAVMVFAGLAVVPARAADLAITVSPGHAIPPQPDIADFDGGSWGGSRPPTPAQMGGGEGGRPARRVTGGPDYVGSSYGLGKPTYSGIGPRPDWGRSSTD